MKLRALSVGLLPGIPHPGFALDHLDDGVHVVVGPNASGKSSLLRALRLALYREERPPGPVMVRAQVALTDGRTVTAQRTGGVPRWAFEGQPCEPPLLPEHHLLGCYLLRLEDLLGPDDVTEPAIQRWLARELAGGYDLRGLWEQGGPFCLGGRIGHAERRALAEAERAVREAGQQVHALRADEVRLAALRHERDAAATAEADVRRHEAAIHLLEARRQLQGLEQQLAALPVGMERVRGDERQRLAALEEQTETTRRERYAARERQSRASARLQSSGLAEDAPLEQLLSALQRRHQGLERDEEQLAHKRIERDEAEAALSSAAAALGAPVPEAATAPSPQAIHAIEERLEQRRELAARKRVLEERLARLPADTGQRDTAALQQARAALARIAGASVWRPGSVGWWTLAALGVLTLAGGVAGALLTPGQWWLAAFASASGGALGALCWQQWRSGRNAAAALGRCGLEAPGRWSEETVAEALSTLGRLLAQAERDRLAAEQRRADSAELDAVARELQTLDAQLGEQARPLGFDPLVLDASLSRWLRLVAEHDRARQRRDATQAALDALQCSVEAARQALAEELARSGEQVPDTADAAALGGALENLAARVRAHGEARRERDEAARDIDRAEAELERLSGARAALLQDLGLGPDDMPALDERLRALPRWRELQDKIAAARGAAQAAAQAVLDDEHVRALVERDDEAEIRRRLEEARGRAARLSELSAEIGAIEERLRQAAAQRPLEHARAQRDRAREACADRREEAFDAIAGQVLLKAVERQYRATAEPEALRQAAHWFARFTRGHFALEADREGLRARETESGELRSLDALSSGTRAQLLLAVRIAFAAQAERGREPLPLFLDEALSTSDPERFRAVASALTALAAEGGRQVFYLTANPGDAAAWQTVDKSCRVIDLAAIRALETAVTDPAALAIPAADAPPSPEGLTPEAYGARLQVPRIDPWADAGGVHLFHILRDDLHLLYRLLGMGLERLGHLEAHLAQGGAALDERERERLARRARAVRSWLEGWRAGRGRPVDRAALARSGAVSDTFLDRVAALAEELGGDPAALLAALERGEVPRFRTHAREELATWLAAEGYLAEGEPLPREVLQARVAAALAVGPEPGEAELRAGRTLAAALDVAVNGPA